MGCTCVLYLPLLGLVGTVVAFRFRPGLSVAAADVDEGGFAVTKSSSLRLGWNLTVI